MQQALCLHCVCKYECELLTLYITGFTVLLKSFGLYNEHVTQSTTVSDTPMLDDSMGRLLMSYVGRLVYLNVLVTDV